MVRAVYFSFWESLSLAHESSSDHVWSMLLRHFIDDLFSIFIFSLKHCVAHGMLSKHLISWCPLVAPFPTMGSLLYCCSFSRAFVTIHANIIINTKQPLRLEIKKKLQARSDRVKSVDIHPSENWVLSALYNGKVFLWDYEKNEMVKSFDICDLPVRCAKVHYKSLSSKMPRMQPPLPVRTYHCQSKKCMPHLPTPLLRSRT